MDEFSKKLESLLNAIQATPNEADEGARIDPTPSQSISSDDSGISDDNDSNHPPTIGDVVTTATAVKDKRKVLTMVCNVLNCKQIQTTVSHSLTVPQAAATTTTSETIATSSPECKLSFHFFFLELGQF